MSACHVFHMITWFPPVTHLLCRKQNKIGETLPFRMLPAVQKKSSLPKLAYISIAVVS
mgnify:CR=1 FL=1